MQIVYGAIFSALTFSVFSGALQASDGGPWLVQDNKRDEIEQVV